MSTMRPIRSIATILLLAAIAVAGCGQSQPQQSTTPATMGSPTTTSPSQPTPTPTTQRPNPRDPVCGGALSWSTDPKQVSAYPITPEIYNVRTATHDACDRVVFDINGLGRVGYLVRYVPLVHADPSDQPIRVAGGAALQVTIQAPDFRNSGHQAWREPWQLGQYLAGGWTTLREVRFAGSFENVTTFAVGVRSQRPFRVLVLPDTGNHITHVVVDIAH
jgi:hypothetical protein